MVSKGLGHGVHKVVICLSFGAITVAKCELRYGSFRHMFCSTATEGELRLMEVASQ